MREAERSIPIPWKVRLRHAARYPLQGLLFVVSLLALVWLWTFRTPQVVITGQVQAVQVAIPASTDGMLVPLDHPIEAFDQVEKGVTLLARFDVSEMLLEMQALTAERDRMEALLRAESERLRLQQKQWDYQSDQHERDREQGSLARRRAVSDAQQLAEDRRQAWQQIDEQIRRLKLRKHEAKTEQVTLSLEAERLSQQRDEVSDLVERSLTPGFRLSDLDQQLELKRRQLTESETLNEAIEKQLADLKEQRDDALNRLNEVTARLPRASEQEGLLDRAKSIQRVEVDAEVSLEPLEQALIVQDAKIRQLAKRIAANEIRAPVSGKISAVHFPPGTFVPLGEPILTIDAEQADWIVVYVDQAHAARIHADDRVRVRRRGREAMVADAQVMEIGTQYQLMPEQLRRNATIAQYGLPIKVAVPEGLPLLPGELVDVVLTEASGSPLSL